MSEAKTTIERADEIVGISVIFAPQGALDYTGDAVKNTYRRGAYVGWMQNLKPDVNPSGFDLPRGIEDMARCVVELHAASKPKGDGLPEISSINFGRNLGEKDYLFQFNGPIRTYEESQALVEYLMRCLTTATRRFLAAFECVGQRPTDIGCFAWGYLNGEPVMVSGPPDGEFPIPERDVICFLKPRATK